MLLSSKIYIWLKVELLNWSSSGLFRLVLKVNFVNATFWTLSSPKNQECVCFDYEVDMGGFTLILLAVWLTELKRRPKSLFVRYLATISMKPYSLDGCSSLTKLCHPLDLIRSLLPLKNNMAIPQKVLNFQYPQIHWGLKFAAYFGIFCLFWKTF